MVRLMASRQISQTVQDEYQKHGQSIYPETMIAINANASLMTQGGNCGEISAKVFTDLACGAIKSGESIENKTDNKIDHQWTELQYQVGHPLQENRVVVDPWTSGPAILAEDSRFGSAQTKPELETQGLIRDNNHAGEFLSYANGVGGYMKNIINSEVFVRNQRAGISPSETYPSYSQNPIPTLSKSFIDKTPSPERSSVASQVQAVGVLRKPDDAKARMSVQDAVAAAPKVIGAADKLRAEVGLHEMETNPPWAR